MYKTYFVDFDTACVSDYCTKSGCLCFLYINGFHFFICCMICVLSCGVNVAG